MVSDKLFIADGTSKIYSVDFLILSDNHCNVFIAGVLQSRTIYDIINNAVVFNTAPSTGTALTIQVGTTPDDLLTTPTDAGIVAANITDVNDVADNISIITNVNTNITDVTTVATNIADVNTTATNIANINAAVANETNINTVVANETNINTVATNVADVNIVAGIGASGLAGIVANETNINLVGTDIANVNTTATNIADVNIVATNIAKVTTVADDIAKVIKVADDLSEAISEVETVANDLNETTSEIEVVSNNIANVNTVGINIASVNTTATDIANVNTTATNIANVNTVATNDANVTKVANIDANVTTVATNDANVTKVANIDSNVTTVATNDANVTKVANIDANVTKVANIDTNVTTVATNDANVTIVANNDTNVTTVATDIANVNTTATNIANVNTTATNIADVNTVATNIANVNAAVANETNINAAVANEANINIAVANVTDINNFADTYFVASTAPASPTNGDLWFDTSGSIMKVYSPTGWQNAGSSVNGIENSVEHIVATGGQTSFAATYDPGYLNVFLNGVKLDSTDYTATDGSTVVLATGAALNDSVFVQSFGTFALADHYSKTASDARYLQLTGGTVTGAITAPDFIGPLNGAVQFTAKNDEGVAITKGQVVYIKGISGDVATVGLADANDPTKMPAFGLVFADANNSAEVEIVTFGALKDTKTDYAGWTFGDTLYVSTTPGTLTNSAPTGETSSIQNIGKIQRVHATAGIIRTGGAGRTNATPNLNDGNVFIGNASNQAVSVALSTVALSPTGDGSGLTGINTDLVSDTTPQLGGSLDLNGNAITGTGAIPAANLTGALPAIDGSALTGNVGKVLQVVSVNTDSIHATTSTAWQTTTIQAIITPKYANSMILVMIQAVMGSSSSYSSGQSVWRNTTQILQGQAASGATRSSGPSAYGGSGDGNNNESVCINGSDFPNTTSATTYYFKFRSPQGGTIIINDLGSGIRGTSYAQTSMSNITLMEIAQ